MKNLAFTRSNIEFKGFFAGIDTCPLSLIAQIRDNCVGLTELKKDYPFFQNRGIVDVLLLVPDEVAKKYPDVYEVKRIIHKISQTLESNYNTFLFKKVQNGVPLAQAHKEGILEFLNLTHKTTPFDLKKIISSNPEESHDNAYSVEEALSLFPKNKRVDLNSVILKENETSKAFPEDNSILLNLEDNVLFQMGEAVHEYAHLVDKEKEDVRTSNIDFLKTRILSSNKIKMKDFLKGQDFKKTHKDAEDTLIYPTTLLDPYAGLVYGSIEENSPSEVLSVGLQALVVNPTSFYLRDPNYFSFVKEFLSV